MSTLSIRLPDSLHARIKSLSKEDHISINQFIASATAEKISALETEKLLLDRSKNAKKKDYLAVLNKVKANPPIFEEDNK